MTKNEYLAALEAALAGVESSVRADVLQELESHIEELRQRKPELPEAELIASLSPPETLARGLREELGMKEGEEEGRGPKPHSGAASRESPPRSNAHFSGHSEDSSRFFGGFHDFGETLRRAVRGIAGGSFGSEIEWRGVIDTKGALSLELDFASTDIDIGPGEGEEIEALFEVEGEEEYLEGWEPALAFSGESIQIGNREHSNVSRLELRIPASILKLLVMTASGDVEIEAGGRDCRVKTRSGDVELQDGASVIIESASGDIEVRGCAVLSAESLSGDVDVEEVAGVVKVKTASGDLNMEGLSSSVDVSTASGDVELRLGAGPLRVKTASGSISLECGPGFKGGEVTSSSGDIEVELEACDLDIQVESVSGDIDVEGKEAGGRVPKRLQTRLGAGGQAFSLRSVSGDVSVSWD